MKKWWRHTESYSKFSIMIWYQTTACHYSFVMKLIIKKIKNRHILRILFALFVLKKIITKKHLARSIWHSIHWLPAECEQYLVVENSIQNTYQTHQVSTYMLNSCNLCIKKIPFRSNSFPKKCFCLRVSTYTLHDRCPRCYRRINQLSSNDSTNRRTLIQ